MFTSFMVLIQLFEDDTMTSDEDERLFTIFESATGQSFIQPTNHKGNEHFFSDYEIQTYWYSFKLCLRAT